MGVLSAVDRRVDREAHGDIDVPKAAELAGNLVDELPAGPTRPRTTESG
jgi:hypothetical protein